MEIKRQTSQSIERFFNKVAQKFENKEIMTDLHIRVSQESGEMLAFDDADKEITRCVVEEWIDNKDEHFYDTVTQVLRMELDRMSETIYKMPILRPFNYVLEGDDGEHIAELYVVDDDAINIIGGDLMTGLDKDLDEFLENLIKQ